MFWRCVPAHSRECLVALRMIDEGLKVSKLTESVLAGGAFPRRGGKATR